MLSLRHLFLVLLSLFDAILLAKSKDVCTPMAVLREIESFQLSQAYQKDVPLNYDNYQGLATEINKYKSDFENIITSYTKDETFNLEEPDQLIPLNEDQNLIRINAQRFAIPLECHKRGAKMVTSSDSKDKNRILEIMKSFKDETIPLGLYPFNGVLASLDNTQLSLIDPTADSAILMKSWPDLASDGTFKYPTTNTRDVTTNAYCKKPANLWDLGGVNRQIFKALMGRIVRQFPSFNKQFDLVSNFVSNKKSKNTTSSLTLIPPFPLIQLGNLIKKFSDQRQWSNTVSGDMPLFTNILKLIKDSRKQFSNILQNKFEIDPPALIDTLGLDKIHYGSDSTIEILSDRGDGVSKITTEVLDNDDTYTLYEVIPSVHKKSVPVVKYIIRSAKRSHEFIGRPALQGCSMMNDNNVCKKWNGAEMPDSRCLQLILGSSSDAKNCPMTQPDMTLSATRTNCLKDNGVYISSSRKKSLLRIYCDNIFQNQVLMTTPTSQINTNCEIREFSNDVESILAPQLNFDLLDTDLNLGLQNNFTPSMDDLDDEWFEIFKYSFPSGLGAVLVISFLVCITAFCIKPARFQQFCACIRCRTIEIDPVPSPGRNSRASHKDSVSRGPSLLSAPISRAVSPARSQLAKVDFSHSYRN